MSFVTSIKIDNRDVNISEFFIRDYKAVLKSITGPEVLNGNIYSNLESILTSKTNLVEHEIRELSVIDFFILLLEIRNISSMSIVTFRTVYKDKSTTLNVDLNNVLKMLKDAKVSNPLQYINDNDIEIRTKQPTLYSICNTDSHELDINMFINEIVLSASNMLICMNKLTNIQKQQIVDSLPLDMVNSLKSIIDTYINNFNNIDVFERFSFMDISLPFNFDTKNLLTLLRFIFNENLVNIYENIFSLCKIGNFAPDYLERCTPGEFSLYVSLLERSIATTSNTNVASSTNSLYSEQSEV